MKKPSRQLTSPSPACVGLRWLLLAMLMMFVATTQANPGHSADADTLNHELEDCHGEYIGPPTSQAGTCDSTTECSEHRSCVLSNLSSCDVSGDAVSASSVTTLACVGAGCAYCGQPADFDCDGVGDSSEMSGFTNPTDPANPAAANADTDGDGVGMFCDNCSATANWNQANSDTDNFGDACDNCLLVDNNTQANSDTDNFGDACDNCLLVNNNTQTNSDTDNFGDACDNCPTVDNNSQANIDGDSAGDACDAFPTDPTETLDTDGDGVGDNADNCPLIQNPDQANNDADAQGDACDTNDDGDALIDTADMCPRNALSGEPLPANGVDIACDLMCLRPSVGVPGMPAPRIPAIDGAVADDVGWRGAHRVTFGNGTPLPHVAFQGLRDNRGDADPANAFVYLSFEVKNDVGGAGAGDTVVLAFRPSFNTAAVLFPAGNAADDVRIIINAAAGTAQVAVHNGSVWNNVAAPTGLAVVMNPAPASNSWDLEVAVPITTTAGGVSWFNFGDYFKFYFNVIRVSGVTASEFVWPEQGHRIGGDVNTYVYDNHEWGIGTKDNSATCNGVYLTSTDIGTTNTPANSILLPSVANPTATNTFFANVQNLSWDSASSNWAQADDINVRFRIADWGILGVGDSPSWREIPSSDPVCPNVGSDNNPTCDQNVAAATSSILPGTQTFNLDWLVSPADQPLYEVATGYDHQCILVELSSSSNANITTKSVYRNMDFSAAASVFERKAKISAAGLGKPPSGQTQHQFILQESREVFKPAPVDEPVLTHMTAAAGRDQKSDNKPIPVPDRGGWGTRSAIQWLVHGYRETGNYVEVEGVQYPLTEPVASFGYVVSHEGGEVAGWGYQLDPVDGGSALERMDDGSYRLAVPENGFREINTRVESYLGFTSQATEYVVQHPLRILMFLLFLVFLWWLIKRLR